jgi:hypothetical protein
MHGKRKAVYPRGRRRALGRLERFAGLWILLALASGLWAQAPVANLTGLVEDSSGAVIPGAKLEIVDTATGVRDTTETNSTGYYSFQLLPPGTYNLRIEKAGFKVVERAGILLSVQQTARIDFILPVGTAVQQVTVTGAPPILQKETSSISQLVTPREVADLPILGRNAYALVQLVPGAFVPASYNSLPVDVISQTYVSINGSRAYQNEYLLDGISNTSAGNSGPAVFPIVDAVQEYRVTTTDYSAEYGRAAGGVFNVAMKSGTNAFHGDAYDYLRNDALDADDFFSNRAGLVIAPFRFNQFGGTFGGPIRKNKTFFFGAYEGVREIQGVTFVDTVPTPAEREGDFSQNLNSAGKLIQIYNPFSTVPNPANPSQFIRTAFTGNIVPPTMIDPAGKALLQYLPLPNTTPGNAVTNTDNFTSANPQDIRKDDFSVRVDHQLSDKEHLFGEVFYDQEDYDRPNAYGNIGTPTYGPVQVFGRRAVVLGDTYDFSPTLIGEFEYGLNRQINLRGSPSDGVNLASLGFPSGFAKSVYPDTLPAILVPGFEGSFSQNNIGPGTTIGEAGLIRYGIDTDTWQGTLMKVAGRHTLNFGGGFQVLRQNALQYSDTGNEFVFSPAFTQGPNPTVASGTAGFAFASFLLGTAASGQANYTPALALQSLYYDGFVEDNFKATPKLTLNLGVRYEDETPYTDRFNQLTNFNFQAVPPLAAPGLNLHGALSFVGVNGNPREQWNPDYDNIGPRLGLAYSLTPRTVLRAGAGIFYAPNYASDNSTADSGFSSVTTFVGSLNTVTPYNVLSNPFPSGLILPPGNSQGSATLLGQSVQFADRDQQTPDAYAWNFDVQRQLPGSFMLGAAYVGDRGLHNYNTLQFDQLPDSDLALGNALLTSVPNPFYGEIASGSLSAATTTKEQLLRPFPQFTGVQADSSTYGSSTYNSMQITAEKQFSHGVSITASYTWSKLMDNATGALSGQTLSGTGFQDYNNLRNEWSVSSLDIPHRFVIGYLWELPFGTGRKYLTAGWAGRAFGGWQVEGITTFASGEVLGLTATNTTNSLGGGQRPNWNGENPVLASPTVNEWFNTSVFSQPPPFTFGNVARTLGNLRASPTNDFDFSLIKNTRLNERITLQFRAESFNLFNTVQFGPPDTGLGDSTFGVVSSQQNQPRIVQLALKLLF